MALSHTIRVAIFDEFLDALYKIPRSQQKKVQRFFRKFRENPTSKSIDFEPIHSFANKNLWTVRVDQDYRAIVLKPTKGNVYVLLWVDKHDAAHAWARNKRCEINPDTGTLQVFSAEPTPPTKAEKKTSAKASKAKPAKPKKKQAKPTPQFAAFDNSQLQAIGVPEALLPTVRALTTEDGLDAHAKDFPPDVFEALFFLLSGESIEQIRDALGIENTTKAVDPEDFETALEQPTTRRRFAVVADDEALATMLHAPLAKWRVFLHPSQRKLVDRTFNGPARVLGGAGTGKTVVAMHRAKYLATEVFTQDTDRILVTTFTNNLARDINENLKALCPPKTMRRIEVVHLDKWVNDFLKRQGYRFKVAYPKSTRSLWEKAVTIKPDGFTDHFLREEWDYVVQPSASTSFDEYKKAKRTGRGKRLSRKQRREIWPVFQEYRNLLEAKNLREPVDAMRDATNLLRHDKGQVNYRAIIVDEAQDMTTTAFELLRQIIPTQAQNDLFIVGDGHQRIYRRKVVLSHAGVNIVGRSKKLYVNYRTTDEIRKYAVAVLNDQKIDDLDGGTDNNSRYVSLTHGQPPTVKHHKTQKAEVKTILAFAKAGELKSTCLVARTQDSLNQYEEELQAAGVKTYRLRRSEAENPEAPGLRLATMHRVKGLEFDRVIIASVNEDMLPLNFESELYSDDEGVREEAVKRERALFYVALTRARKDVLVTSFGRRSGWLG